MHTGLTSVCLQVAQRLGSGKAPQPYAPSKAGSEHAQQPAVPSRPGSGVSQFMHIGVAQSMLACQVHCNTVLGLSRGLSCRQGYFDSSSSAVMHYMQRASPCPACMHALLLANMCAFVTQQDREIERLHAG